MPRRVLVERALLVACLWPFAHDARATHKEDPIGTRPPSSASDARATHKEDPIGTRPPSSASDARATHKEDPIGSTPQSSSVTIKPVAPVHALTLRRDVYFEATSPRAQLQVWYPDGWRTLCVHPGCLLTHAYVGAKYRVAGPGLVASRPFSVHPNPGTLHVRADTGSSAAHSAGGVLMGLGSAAMLVGSGWLGLATLCLCSQEEKERAMTPGALVIFGGAVSLTVGIVLFTTTHTELKFGRQTAPLSSPSAFRRGLDLVTTGVKF